ncbi:MAG: adenylate/guanylate cyclase domain-containing protein [Deltaproteobacteria bacterium]|nr:adenylate/guanylate cyclase domain-containing protein [Deltaproteobacteria bacterium]
MSTTTRTVVFTDLADYTASVSRANREALRDLLHTHETLVVPLIRRHQGRVVKNLGDSFMALFDAATDAVRAGLDLLERAQGVGLSLKIGVATGDVEEIEGDAFGDAVNLASRVNASTPADEVWFSESTLLCMNQAEIPWDHAGLHTLKGMSGEVPLFRAVPPHRAWLPGPVIAAARHERLLVVEKGAALPGVPVDPVVLLKGFTPGSDALAEALAGLPVLDPTSIWLVAYHLAPLDRYAWQHEAGHGLVIGTPRAVDEAIGDLRRVVVRDPGSDTIILETGLEAALDLAIVGLALPRVPLSDVVAGYTYDLLQDGRWVNDSERSVARLEVTPGSIVLFALSPGVVADDHPVTAGEHVLLQDGLVFQVGETRHEFHAVQNGPYEGFILTRASLRLPVAQDQRAELGREPGHPGLALPDRRGQENIRWCGGPRAARAREGGFTIDRALVGRRQAAVHVLQGTCEVEALHERCPTWIWHPDGPLDRVQGRVQAAFGDHIVAGTTIVALRAPGS